MANTEDASIDVITVVASEEKFSPVQYHSFGVGGFRYTTAVRPNETPEEAFERAWAFLNKMKQQHFLEVRNAFYERLNLSRPTDDDYLKFDD